LFVIVWSVRWRRPQLRSGSGRVENVRYGLLGLALTTTTIVWVRSFSKMLPSVKFAEDKVLVFVILRFLK